MAGLVRKTLEDLFKLFVLISEKYVVIYNAEKKSTTNSVTRMDFLTQEIVLP